MKRAIIAFLVTALAAPAGAQSASENANAELKAFLAHYVELFNNGDMAGIAGLYELPGVSTADLQAKLSKQLAALRADEFGKMTLYGSHACPHGAGSAQLEMAFAYNYTYGGVMPPGDRSTVFEMRKTDAGWRIVNSKDMPQNTGIVCAL